MELKSGHSTKLPLSTLYGQEACADTSTALSAFIAQHTYRYREVLERLPDTHRHIVTALPYLFHFNSPSLPGWCSKAPKGIDHYQPNQSHLNAVRAIAPANRLRKEPVTTTIEAIYLMGSAGSLAQTRTSDIDVWICLPESLHTALEGKLLRLEAWAKTMGLELQMFMVDPCRFKNADPRDQGYSPLLLDEFYRSSCHLAGRYPLWWLTPAGCNPVEYDIRVDALRSRRLINTDSFHDFGPVQALSRDAVLSATLTQFAHSLHTPHKSLLKLGLLESYFRGAPLLSERYKAAVLEDRDKTQRDVYTLLIEHLERHFATEPARKQFFRTAWLTKTVRGNSRLGRNPQWRQRALEWGFDRQDIEHMRWPRRWSMPDLLHEQALFGQAYAAVCAFMRDLLAGAGFIDRKLIEECLRALELGSGLAAAQGPLHPGPVANYNSRAEFVRTRKGWGLRDHGTLVYEAESRVALLYWLKMKGFPRETLKDDRARWLDSLWPSLENRPLLVFNGEPEPDRAHASHDIWSADLIDKSGRVRSLTYGEAIAAAINHGASIICADDLRTRSIERDIAAIRTALTADGAIFLAITSGQPHAWIRKNTNIISRVYKDEESLVAELPCSSEIIWHDDGVERWLELLHGPTLFVMADGIRADLIYRDQSDKYQIAAPHRPLAHFFHSIQLFVGMLSRRGIKTPKVYANATDLRGPDYAALGFKVIFRHLNGHWLITTGADVFSAPELTRTLLRRVRMTVLEHRKTTEDYPIYLTDLELPDENFHTHLVTKLRIEQLLSRVSLSQR